MRSQKRRLLSRAENYLRARVGFPQTWENARLLDRSFTVRKGTIRANPDYDDAWLLALAMHSGTVIDAGSNIGQAAFVLLYPDAVRQLILVEPNPKALAIAAENLIHNQLVHRVRFVCAFASDKAGESIPFWTVSTGSAGSVYAEHARTAAKRHQSFNVLSTTIDVICEKYNVVPELVKIDTEGAEFSVLQGSTNLARHNASRFFVEMHSNPTLPMHVNAQNVLNWCHSHQYRAWYLAGKVELTSPNQIETRGRCHLLLQPIDWDFPKWLQMIDQGAPLEQVT